jgi:hydrogenase maturation protein HypF
MQKKRLKLSQNENISNNQIVGYQILIFGVVQGVGFRPFVYREAKKRGLHGFVRNSLSGVELKVQGIESLIQDFIDKIIDSPPPMARVDMITKTRCEANSDSTFSILESSKIDNLVPLISPDLATCEICLSEIKNSSDRRYKYPFTNCTNCGPRFTIIKDVPYDRFRTTMDEFDLCPKCHNEYIEISNRRYHAEPNACSYCGPKLTFINGSITVDNDNEKALSMTQKYILSGKIVAIKGIGGFHLACDAKNIDSVNLLRNRKNRPHKPMAIMCPDLNFINKYCEVANDEIRELESVRRPILLLKIKKDISSLIKKIFDILAPNHGFVGIMLPYAPLHYLLFEDKRIEALVMTSANISEEPIVIDNDHAVEKLDKIADGYLIHNRKIHNRCDDSVGYFDDKNFTLLRRSRGFTPLPVTLPYKLKRILAVGAMYNNVFAISDDNRIFLSQHIGDVENMETLSFLKESLNKFQKWLDFEPEIIVHDMHPDYLTTHLAKELLFDCPRIEVQHHHAHLASVIATHNIEGEIQALVLDGTGYGPDKTIWGCELLTGSAKDYSRKGHLQLLPLPGGEAAIKKPINIAVSYLLTLHPESIKKPLNLWSRISKDELELIQNMIVRKFNSPMNSSAGRLFDAIAAILDVRDEISYEAQAAMELEQLAHNGKVEEDIQLEFELLEENGELIIDPRKIIYSIVEYLIKGKRRRDLALAFHIALAKVLAKASRYIYESGNSDQVALCGGVFQNRLLTRYTAKYLEDLSLIPILPGLVPVNDAGIALGQILVANANFKENNYLEVFKN